MSPMPGDSSAGRRRRPFPARCGRSSRRRKTARISIPSPTAHHAHHRTPAMATAMRMAIDERALQRGLDYARRGKVLDLRPSPDAGGILLEGSVSGSGKCVYECRIRISRHERHLLMETGCSCPVGATASTPLRCCWAWRAISRRRHRLLPSLRPHRPTGGQSRPCERPTPNYPHGTSGWLHSTVSSKRPRRRNRSDASAFSCATARGTGCCTIGLAAPFEKSCRPPVMGRPAIAAGERTLRPRARATGRLAGTDGHDTGPVARRTIRTPGRPGVGRDPLHSIQAERALEYPLTHYPVWSERGIQPLERGPTLGPGRVGRRRGQYEVEV